MLKVQTDFEGREISMHQTTKEKNGSAIIVGASLSGLMTAISLAREEIQVTVIEKVDSRHRLGAGLQVDEARFNAVGTERLLRNLASGGKRSIQLWSSIEYRLRNEAQADFHIEILYGTRVVKVQQNEHSAWVETSEGKCIAGDVVIGADGHNSLVRQHVSPENATATFAGYMVWIASTKEEELPKHLRPRYNHPEVTMLDSLNGFLFGSIITSLDEPTNRRIGCTWYDNSRNDLLRSLGCVEKNRVNYSLKGSEIPSETLAELGAHVSLKWEDPWKSAMLHALQTRSITGTPIKEYVPNALVKGRIALIGDAAHVPAPITASGFNASLEDAVELGRCMAKGIRGSAANKALKKYESKRLTNVRNMVQSGKSYSQLYGLSAE